MLYNSSTTNNAFIGYQSGLNIGLIILENITIDSSNIVSGSDENYAPAIIRFDTGNGLSANNIVAYPTGNCRSGMTISFSLTSTLSTIQDCFFVGNFRQMCFELFNSTYDPGSYGESVLIQRCFGYNIINPIPSEYTGLVYIDYGGAKSIDFSASDCLFISSQNLSRPTFLVDIWDYYEGTGNFGVYINNCASLCSNGLIAFDSIEGGVPTSALVGNISANPNLKNLPAAVSIDPGCKIPNGYAVTNLTDYNKKGNGTLLSEGLSANYSPTGIKYSITDNTTPGPSYKLLWNNNYNVLDVSGETVDLVNVSNKPQSVLIYINSDNNVCIKPNEI
jgi:hypothetical protein